MTVISIVIGALGTVTKGLVKGIEELEDPPNDSTVKIGHNTEKSLGDLRRLTVTQTLVKGHQMMLVGKTLNGVE